jgi:tripartite-type tricarboxylate transporter receptor subunit TctC
MLKRLNLARVLPAIICVGLLSFLIAGFPTVSNATDYPTKPIQIIAAFPPGGAADTTARIVAPKVSALLGQPVVVVNKPGGGGVIGTYAAKAAPPDGYTILLTSPPMLLAPLLTKGITFDLLKDFVMINLTITGPCVLVVKKDAPWQKVEELIAEAKRNPGKLTYSGAGYGTTPHFSGEMFKMYTGTDITHVPMDGIARAMTAVLGGHTNMAFPEVGMSYKYLQAGSLRGLLVLGKSRHQYLPDIPTGVEKGFPNLITVAYQGFSVPAKTPQAIVEKLEKAFKEAVNDKEVIEMFEKTGWVVENHGSKEMTEFLIKDLQRKKEVAKAANIVPK